MTNLDYGRRIIIAINYSSIEISTRFDMNVINLVWHWLFNINFCFSIFTCLSSIISNFGVTGIFV